MTDKRLSVREKSLTSLAKTCGWAAKASPVGLESILSGLDIITNRDVLVGFDTRDDAGVFRALDVNLIRLNLGYTRKIFNSDPLANREFLLLENSIIEYPWNDD